MAAPIADVSTPRRVFFLDNICAICSFAFVRKDINSKGEETIIKNTNQKLKLSLERTKNIQRVVVDFDVETSLQRSDAGICITCYRQVEKFIRLSSEITNIRESLNSKKAQTFSSNALCIPSPSRPTFRTKRLLRSPISDQPNKVATSQLGLHVPQLAVTKVVTATLQPFSDIVSNSMVPRPILPRPEVTVPGHRPDVENVPPKQTRRSLSTEFREVESSDVSSQTQVEVHCLYVQILCIKFVSENHKGTCI